MDEDTHGTEADLLSRICVDPNVCFGKPRIRGTRIWVGLVLGMLAHGTNIETLLADYPQLEETDVLACLAYGAELANGRVTDLPDMSHPVG